MITQAQSFASGDLNALQQAAGLLPVPDGPALIGGVLDSFGQMAQRIPSDPRALTAELSEGLDHLKTDLVGLGGVLGPIASITEVVKPLLQQADLLSHSITRINSVVTDLSGVSSGLNLANISEQIEYLSRILGVFPELADRSPFKELKTQVDTFKAWLTLTPADLSEHFRAKIQSLAEALPARLDAVMQSGLDAARDLEGPVAALDRNTWCVPYQQALQAVEAIDLNDLSQVGNHLATLNAQIAQLTGIADTLTQRVRDGLGALDAFNPTMFAQDLVDALSNVLSVIGPGKPGMLAVILNQVRVIVGGLGVGDAREQVARLEREVDQLFGQLDLSAFTGSIRDVTDRIVSTVGTVDQALVEVATVLSNLVTELRTLIGGVDLNGVVNQVQTAFTQLSDGVNGLSGQVNSVMQQIDQFVTQVGQDIDNIDVTSLADGVRSLLSQITAVLEDPAVQQVLDAVQQGIADMAANLQDVTLTPVFDEVVGQMEKVKADLDAIDVSNLNDALKLALGAAVEVLRGIKFAEHVTDALNTQFNAILGNSSKLVEPLREKYEELEGKIDEFHPGALVAAQLASPFESLVAELNKIQPAQLVRPLEELHRLLIDQLEPLNPAQLLAPLAELHGQLLDTLRSLSPHDLLTPLNNVLGEVTGLLDDLNVESFITEVTDSINQINTFVNNFSLADQLRNTDGFAALGQIQMHAEDILGDVEQKVDQFLDQLVIAVPAVDMSILQPALDALRSAVAAIENHVDAPEILTRLATVQTTLQTQDFRGCLTELTRRWSAQKTRFEGFTPPPPVATEFETLSWHEASWRNAETIWSGGSFSLDKENTPERCSPSCRSA